MGRKLGDCALLREEKLGPHLTQCGQGLSPGHIVLDDTLPSFILIHPTIWPCAVYQRHRQTNRTDRSNSLIAQGEQFLGDRL